MHKFFLTLLLLSISVSFADTNFRLPEQCIYGSWKSDKEKTVEYNLPAWQWAWEHAFEYEITPERRQAIFNIFGDMEWTFNPDGTAHSYMSSNPPEWQRKSGKYKIIQSGKNFLLTRSYDEEKQEYRFMTYFFENPNLLWVRIGNPKLFSRNNREYFRRMTPTPKECVMP